MFWTPYICPVISGTVILGILASSAPIVKLPAFPPLYIAVLAVDVIVPPVITAVPRLLIAYLLFDLIVPPCILSVPLFDIVISVVDSIVPPVIITVEPLELSIIPIFPPWIFTVAYWFVILLILAVPLIVQLVALFTNIP